MDNWNTEWKVGVAGMESRTYFVPKHEITHIISEKNDKFKLCERIHITGCERREGVFARIKQFSSKEEAKKQSEDWEREDYE